MKNGLHFKKCQKCSGILGKMQEILNDPCSFLKSPCICKGGVGYIPTNMENSLILPTHVGNFQKVYKTLSKVNPIFPALDPYIIYYGFLFCLEHVKSNT